MELALALQLVLLAGSAGGHHLTLQQALAQADARNPDVLQAELGLPVAERGVDAAATLFAVPALAGLRLRRRARPPRRGGG